MKKCALFVVIACSSLAGTEPQLLAQCVQTSGVTSFVPGIDGDVEGGIELPSGELVFFGDFGTVGNIRVGNIARFDPETRVWDSMGAGTNGAVRSAVVLPDGRLMVGGWFTTMDAKQTGALAIWDGAEWTVAAGAPFGSVSELGLLPDGRVAITGRSGRSFSEPAVRVWDGQTLETLGTLTGEPVDLHVSNTGEPVVLVGNTFLTQGTQLVWKWDGTSWQPLGSYSTQQMWPIVEPRTVSQLPSGEWLLGGRHLLARAGEFAFNGVMLLRLREQTWEPVLSGPTNAFVRSLSSSNGRDVVVSTAGSSEILSTEVQRYDGTTFTPTPNLRSLGRVERLETTSGAFYYSGVVTTGPNGNARGVARLDGSTWQPIGRSGELDGAVGTVFIEDSGEAVIAGAFTRAGAGAASGIARGDGLQWTATGIAPPAGPQEGWYTTEQGVRFYYPTSGSTLSPVRVFENGETRTVGSVVRMSVSRSIELADGRTIFSGYLQREVGGPVWKLFSWNGGFFDSFGPSATQQPDGVDDIVQLSNGDVMAVGSFNNTVIDRPAPIAIFRNDRWFAADDGFQSSPSTTLSLHRFGEELFLCATQQGTGDNQQSTFWRWHGTGWTPAFAPIRRQQNRPSIVVTPAGETILGGTRTGVADSLGVRTKTSFTGELLQWTENGWSLLATFEGPIFDLDVLPSGELIVAGAFTKANEQPAYGVVVMSVRTRCCDEVDFDRDGVSPTDADVIAFLDVLAGAPCPYPVPCDLDFNNDYVVPDDRDVLEFFAALAGDSCE